MLGPRDFVVGLAVVAALVGGPGRASAGPATDEIEILRNRPTGMEDEPWRKRRREAAEALGDTRSPEAVDALIEVVQTERYDAVLSIAIRSLAKQGDPRAIPPLQAVYGDRSLDTFVRREAADAIVALGGTPRDDAKLVGGTEGPTAAGPVLGDARIGPQLGTMGEASVDDETDDVNLQDDKPLPDGVRARSRDFGFVLGRLDLDIDTRVTQQPVLADGGLGAYARYVDERHRWGWSVWGDLSGRVRNGDATSLPNMDDDDGNTLFVRQALQGAGEAHVYFGKTDVHAFGELGLSQRVTHVRIDDIADGNQSELTDTRFAVDVIPGAGLGWGRYLDASSDVLVDALADALREENILVGEIGPQTRKAIRDAIYRRSNTFSAYPRTAAVIAILTRDRLLARAPGPRVVHRIRSIVEDPSYVDRPRGIRVRVGFLYDAAIGQRDYLGREGDAVGAPFVQFEAGFPIDIERQIVADARFWYDVLGERGFTSDAGATYTRYLHTRYDDYAGHWFGGVRGGASQRSHPELPDDVDVRIGYRAVGQVGYAYGFRRGSEFQVRAEAGADSGGFVATLGLGVRIGIARGSVYGPAPGP